jgi:hypothetical protein
MMAINLTAILLAAIANFIIGFLFHGPVFGKLWMKLANIHPTRKEKFRDIVPQMIKNFLANIVFAFGLSLVYAVVSVSGVMESGILLGIVTAFLVWFGFLLPSSSIEVIWMGRTNKLWLFESFASLVSCLAMGAILATW